MTDHTTPIPITRYSALQRVTGLSAMGSCWVGESVGGRAGSLCVGMRVRVCVCVGQSVSSQGVSSQVVSMCVRDGDGEPCLISPCTYTQCRE